MKKIISLILTFTIILMLTGCTPEEEAFKKSLTPEDAATKILMQSATRFSVMDDNSIWMENPSVDNFLNAEAIMVRGFNPEDSQLILPLSQIKKLILYVDGGSFKDSKGLEFISEMPNLEILTLDVEDKINTPIQVDFLGHCENLKELSISGGSSSYDLSSVEGLDLEKLYTVGYQPAELSQIGTVEYLYVFSAPENLGTLKQLEIKTLNLNNSWVNPPMIDFDGVEELNTVETLLVDDCAIVDFAPVLDMSSLTNLVISADWDNEVYFDFPPEERPVKISAENIELLDLFKWNVPVEMYKLFLEKSPNNNITIWLRHQ